MELQGSDTVAGDTLGNSVAISGSTVIVGAYDHAKSAGRAYVFATTGSGWKQMAELQGPDTVAGDQFGSSVSVSGTTAVVGAGGHADHAGRAYVFAKTPSGWKQTAELKGSDTVAGDYFGWSVAISGAEHRGRGLWARQERRAGLRVHRDAKGLDPGRRAEVRRHPPRGPVRLLGGHLGPNDRGGCDQPRRRSRSGVRFRQDRLRMEAGCQAAGTRHHRR